MDECCSTISWSNCVVAILFLTAVGCSSNHAHLGSGGLQEGVDWVTGTVTYRVRMILPPDALVRLDLVDISRQGSPALTIGLQENETAGRQVPIPFEISYKKASIDPKHIYSVQARILVGSRLLFTNTIPYHVITNGVVRNIEIILEQVPGR